MRWPLPYVGDIPTSPLRALLLRRTLAGFGLALIAATWRLWTPQSVFPQVPLVHQLDGLPAWCQWTGACILVLSLAAALMISRQGRAATAALVTFAAAVLGMALVDQERLQPWAYQFAIMALVLALADARRAFGLLRLLIVGFYFHSALTKLDDSFLRTLGQQFLATLLAVVGATPVGWSDSARLAAAAVFPGSELAIALGLCFARTRRVALAGAVLLHVLLLVILGPWGLGHKPGVLVWNLYFIVQDCLLFWIVAPGGAATPDDASPASRFSWIAGVLVVAAVLLPFLEPTAWFDIWPSWGLYASSAERVELVVHRRALEQLPDSLAPFVESPADPADPWLALRLDRWSLAALGAPIYPQSRFQLGVAEATIVRYGLGHRARVVRLGMARRFTGRRQHQVFSGLPEIIAAGDDYFFNTRPRQRAFAPPVVAP